MCRCAATLVGIVRIGNCAGENKSDGIRYLRSRLPVEMEEETGNLRLPRVHSLQRLFR